MTETSRIVLEQFQIRKSKRQKEAFRSWLCDTLTEMGYAPQVERRGISRNVVAGDPEAPLLLTAHYDTCAVLPVPNFITPRNFVWYLAYQMLLMAGIFAVAVAAEVALLLLWPEAPLWLALAVVYGVLVFQLWWILAGPANRNTANDNTSGVMTLLEIAAALPETQRERVCFVFFDNEEKGLLGVKSFVRMHRTARKKALAVNFDCVSDGDDLHLFPNRRLKRDADAMAALERAFVGEGEKTVTVVRGFGLYPSDQTAFARGVGVCALKKKKLVGYYMDRIHTRRDTVLEEENIRILRDGALRLAGALAAPAK